MCVNVLLSFNVKILSFYVISKVMPPVRHLFYFPLRDCLVFQRNESVFLEYDYFCDIMAKKIEKTNAARLLDKAGIKYNLIPYEFDENDLAVQHVADSLGQDIARVFKTLVLHGDRTGYIVCVVPGDGEVDLKALAKVSGNKKVEMIAMKDLLSVTGYIRGGCSPIGMKKRFPTYFHSTVLSFETIYVSAGVRGLQVEIAPADLIGFTSGVVADVACFQ